MRIYGEFCLPAQWDPATDTAVDMDESQASELDASTGSSTRKASGRRRRVPQRRAGALEYSWSQRYPNNSTSIPDQIRAEEFLRELGEREKSGKLPEPVVITLN